MAAGTTTRIQTRQTTETEIDLRLPQPEAVHLTLRTTSNGHGSDGDSEAIPQSVVLLRPDLNNPSQDQLFLDRVPVARDSFHFDEHHRTLSWEGLYGGGQLNLTHDGLGGKGLIGAALEGQAVAASATASFICDTATNAGTGYESSGQSMVGLTWDPTSAAWAKADWQTNRLKMRYTVHPGSVFSGPTFDFTFQDTVTSQQWSPNSPAASLNLGMSGGQMAWQLTFKSTGPPPAATAPGANGQAGTVLPFWLQANEDAAAYSIDGALVIDAPAPKGTVLALRGSKALPSLAGYYQTESSQCPFGIFDGQIHIGDQPIATSHVRGRELLWHDLDADTADATGLPRTGSLSFTHDGYVGSGDVRVRRLGTTQTMLALRSEPDRHPTHLAAFEFAEQQLLLSSPQITGLLTMASQLYIQDKNGQWYDQIQRAVTNDLSTIMNSFVPSAMWTLLFPNTPQTPLTGELATVASSPVTGQNPSDFYQSLATAVMTNGMADGSDDACQYMNGPRAGRWLQEHVATSKVYYEHGQKLFHYHWGQTFGATAQYLNDQETNAATWAPKIDQRIQQAVADINQNVVTNADSPKGLKPKMIAEVQAVGAYAKTNNLFWAFAYYINNTSPSILANIAMEMGTSTGSTDGMVLTRMFQANASVLTALDPSGYFAQQYTKTVNQFLATNIIPSMYDFAGDASNFDMIKAYLEHFVSSNLQSQDQAIAAAAQHIKDILDGKNADAQLHAAVEAIRGFAETVDDAMAFPYVAGKFVTWMQTNFQLTSKVASVVGSVFMAGVAGLAVMNLFTAFKSWDKLSKVERATVIVETVQFAIQFVAAVAQRGVRLSIMFSENGLTNMQRVGAFSKIVMTGESKVIDDTLLKMGNGAAKWVADTKFTTGVVPILDEAGEIGGLMATDAEVGMLGRIMGRSLDEFIATRLGPVFILAGIGLSIAAIASGDTGVALAGDIINIIGGSLMLFATVGGFLVEAGTIAAEGLMATLIAAAGPFAILAALIGIGLMLYMMFKKPPDPIQKFVDQYVKPAGLDVRHRQSAIDYVTQFPNADKGNLMMQGMRLTAGGSVVTAQNDGSATLGTGGFGPDSVWQVKTSGSGMSHFMARTTPDATKGPVWLYLTMWSDGSVTFADGWKWSKTPAQNAGGATIQTQTWFTEPTADAILTSDKLLSTLQMNIAAVIPDSNGVYRRPGTTAPRLQTGGTGLVCSSGPLATVFTIEMAGLAPDEMAIRDMSFILNSTPSAAESFGPSFGEAPSTPLTYTNQGTLPPFLVFDSTEGTFAPNGTVADTAFTGTGTVTATNALGSSSASYTITVAAPS